MKCPVCGQIIDDDSDVCVYCGYRLKDEKQDSKEDKNRDIIKRQIENYRKQN